MSKLIYDVVMHTAPGDVTRTAGNQVFSLSESMTNPPLWQRRFVRGG